MDERIISLDWEYIDGLLDHVDKVLTTHRFPTVLRLRAQLAVETLFRALVNVEGAETGKLRFTFEPPQTLLLQFRNALGVLRPDDSAMALEGSKALYGVKMQLSEGSCMIKVGVK